MSDAQTTKLPSDAERDWDEGQAVSEVVRGYINERDAALSRLAVVQMLAERAERKGYDLDPYEVLEACKPPVMPGDADE